MTADPTPVAGESDPQVMRNRLLANLPSDYRPMLYRLLDVTRAEAASPAALDDAIERIVSVIENDEGAPEMWDAAYRLRALWLARLTEQEEERHG